MKKISSKMIFGILTGIILGITMAAYAVSVPSEQVLYSNSATSETTVNGALTELLNLSQECKSRCPEGYTCTEKKLCKRASTSTLHTETCMTGSACHVQNNYKTYGHGDTITYGNISTTAGTLKAGDAFDCDVNGNGHYESDSERFYYVSTMNNGHMRADSNIAVLAYAKTSNTYRLSSGHISYNNYGNTSYGPQYALNELYNTTQWKNAPEIRSGHITDSSGNILKLNFSYSGYASRLLTYQEVSAGCSIPAQVVSYNSVGVMDSGGPLSYSCNFLLEDSNYSNSSNSVYYIWLESGVDGRNDSAFDIDTYSSNVSYDSVTSMNYARPAIEVPLSDIDY
ncbi:MAG: hypothetical protein E7158_00835 [Firmicutes bacterium]|nr:hypothetical protein [Bacillota bacterium]